MDLGSLVFRVHIAEGKGFGSALQALCCTATLGEGNTRSTPFSVGRGEHRWDATLAWATSRDQLRRLSTAGQTNCKLSVIGKDGRRVGWVLLDLRKARLNKEYSKEPQGEWLTLLGCRPGEAAPQIRVQFSLSDESRSRSTADEAQLMQQLDSKLAGKAQGAGSPGAPAPAAASSSQGMTQTSQDAPPEQQPDAAGGLATVEEEEYSDDFGEATEGAAPPAPVPGSESGQQGEGTRREEVTSPGPGTDTGAAVPSPPARPRPPSTGGRGQQSSGGGSSSAQVSSGGSQPPSSAAPTQGPAAPGPQAAAGVGAGGQAPQGGGAPAAAPGGGAEGLVRAFALTLDVRTFQAGTRLPLNLAKTYIQAVLPADVLELVVASGYRLPSKMAPLRTSPAVDIARGAEGALPNGVGSVDFAAGVVQLARVLARDPRVSVEVWHKERFRADTLLGVASIPLSPLLYDSWVDGYAPVYALVASAPPPGAGPEALQPQRVEVGMLRVVIALEDKGHASLPSPQPPPAAPASAQTSNVTASPVQAVPYSVYQPYQEPHVAPPPSPPAHSLTTWHAQLQPPPQPQALPPPLPPVPQAPNPGWHPLSGSPRSPGAAPPPPVASFPQQPPITAVQSLPEYEAAYQLEVWKKGEEVKWRAALREREAARMAVLEGEWRKRERAREAEVAAMRAEYTSLEERARQVQGVLAAAEDRERKLVAAEEAAQRRRKDLEREHAARMLEAEAAVRRLQVECEHQLEIERDRCAELARQRAALEERLAVAEARHAALEQAFASYREQMRGTSEVALQRELLEVRDALRRAEERAARAVRAKGAYKEQVLKLAEQLATLYRVQQQQADSFGLGRRGMGLRQAAEEHARVSSHQQSELEALRQQLRALKDSALASVSPPRASPAAPRVGLAPGGAGGGAGLGSARLVQYGAEELDVDVRRGGPGGQVDQSAPASAPPSSRGVGQDPLEVARRQLAQRQQQLAVAEDGGGAAAGQPPGGGSGGDDAPGGGEAFQGGASLTLRHLGQGVTGSGGAGATAAGPPALTQQEGTPTRSRPSGSTDPSPETVLDLGASHTTGRPSVVAAHNPATGDNPGRVALAPSPLASWPPSQSMSPMAAAQGGPHFNPEAAPTASASPQQRSGPSLADLLSEASHGPGARPPSASEAAVLALTSAPASASQGDAGPLAPGQVAEIRRLLRRKSELLATGAYEAGDPLIARIEARVAQLAGLPSLGSARGQ